MNLKKIISLVLCLLLLTSGCGKKNKDNIVKKMNEEITSLKNYNLKGNMEIYTDEETFTYSIEVDYLKDNFYKVNMVNQTNNHEQIILRNNDAVYVITPSLNKSFKFQSEWPDNSSQAYLLMQINKDIQNDSSKVVEEQNGDFIIKSAVNYPNNPSLKYQKTTLDKDGKLKKNEIYDEKDKLKMKVTITSTDYKANLKESDFKLENYITETKEEDNKKETENCSTDTCKEKKTGVIEEILYPLYVPSNTFLSKSDKVSTDTGERYILTFAGDKNFVLVEEVASIPSEFEIIPVYGDPLVVSDTIGALGVNSLTWTKNNISYYLTSSDLTNNELLTIGESIGYNNKSVSKEK